MTRRIVISGCSGGGKSSLLDALSKRGFTCFTEPGRQVARTALATGGHDLPWINPRGFMQKVIGVGLAQWADAQGDLCFYDRSLIDAVSWFLRQPEPVPDDIAALETTCRYDRTVFLTPPWAAIYTNDAARRHTYADAIAEYDALLASYPANGYQVVIIPKMPIADRVDWLLDQIKEY